MAADQRRTYSDLHNETAEQLADWANQLRERIERTREDARRAADVARELIKKHKQIEPRDH
jgi:hypothetical protein